MTHLQTVKHVTKFVKAGRSNQEIWNSSKSQDWGMLKWVLMIFVDEVRAVIAKKEKPTKENIHTVEHIYQNNSNPNKSASLPPVDLEDAPALPIKKIKVPTIKKMVEEKVVVAPKKKLPVDLVEDIKNAVVTPDVPINQKLATESVKGTMISDDDYAAFQKFQAFKKMQATQVVTQATRVATPVAPIGVAANEPPTSSMTTENKSQAKTLSDSLKEKAFHESVALEYIPIITEEPPVSPYAFQPKEMPTPTPTPPFNDDDDDDDDAPMKNSNFAWTENMAESDPTPANSAPTFVQKAPNVEIPLFRQVDEMNEDEVDDALEVTGTARQRFLEEKEKDALLRQKKADLASNRVNDRMDIDEKIYKFGNQVGAKAIGKKNLNYQDVMLVAIVVDNTKATKLEEQMLVEQNVVKMIQDGLDVHLPGGTIVNGVSLLRSTEVNNQGNFTKTFGRVIDLFRDTNRSAFASIRNKYRGVNVKRRKMMD